MAILKRYVFDLDSTLCTDTWPDYSKAEPMVERIKRVNQLYKEGYTIYIQTARGMESSANNTEMARAKYGDMTHKQLREFGVKYHKLFFGKVAATYYIDDKAINAEDFFKPQDN